MSRSTGPTLLERSEASRETPEPPRVPGRFSRGNRRAKDTATPTTADAAEALEVEPATAAPSPADAPTTATTTAATDDAPATGTRRLPRPPGRRGPLWLAALIAGALCAATPGLLGDEPAAPVSVSAADYGIGADMNTTGDMEDAGVRQGLSEAEAQARLGELAASRAARTPTTADPVPGARMTTCFCMRWGTMHWGLDLAAPLGTPIYATTDGVVLRAGRASGYGNAVYIQDADGDVHIYGHMRYYDVEAGQIVHAGDEIARVGSEGQSTGPHLHYEIHRGGENGRRIDPEDYLAERGVEV
ncbi:M23 family metallopeptidase [Trujillonella endophytica]|uniref:Peptidase family M23 n=1 Tax=Trujillonella endophytica TaxID=673521 RepID=A0A1H8RQP8_9ACTN|nr:M23 family metallopeptidase [Trujillella endophytica]SEO68675.1 Peptidase family M23 [Trujillella endophytica]